VNPSPPVIALDARPLSTPLSGVGRVIANVLRRFPDPESFRFLLFSHKPPHPDFQDLLEFPWISWEEGRGPGARFGGVWFNFVLPFLLRGRRIDLFWGSQQVLPPGLPRGLPAVLTYYDLVLYFFPEAMRPLARAQQRLVQAYSVRRADRILSISRQTQEDMIRKFSYPPEKARPALLGVDPREMRRTGPRTKPRVARPYMLAVSTLEPRKNYSVLLEAFALYAKSEKKPHRLAIVGKRGWESPEFFRRLDELRASTGLIEIVENASDSELLELYSNAAFFCFPTLYEGFGLPLLEALAQGCNCLVSDIPCLHEIGGDTIQYLPPRDVQAWARALGEMTSRDRAGKLKKVRFPLKDWTWEKTARIHRDAFAELLGGS